MANPNHMEEVLLSTKMLAAASDRNDMRYKTPPMVKYGSAPSCLQDDVVEESTPATSSTRLAAAQLVQRCALAIAIGAALYNRGATNECIEVYAQAMRTSLGCAETPPDVSCAFQDALQSSQTFLSASRRAWSLRRALNEAILAAAQTAGASCPPPSASPTTTGWEHYQRVLKRPAVRSYKESTSACRLSEAQDELCYLLALPHEMSMCVLSQLPARVLARLACTCTSLHQRVHEHAVVAMRMLQPKLFQGTPAAGEFQHPRWLHSLMSIELLTEAVGPPPADGRKWTHEWAAMRTAEALHTGQAPPDARTFLPGGERSIKALLQKYAAGLSWMIDCGWSPVHASCTMLLLACGSSAIGASIRARSSEFAASAHALCDALRQRAWAISTPAPPTYASIEGQFGLATTDDVWAQLLAEDVRPGLTFLTSAPLQASVHPTRMPEAARQNGPMHRLASAACELRCGGPIVCFLSRAGGNREPLRTLIQTSPIGFALPPLVTVRLVSAHEPGAWQHGGNVMWRKCFCVHITVCGPHSTDSTEHASAR